MLEESTIYILSKSALSGETLLLELNNERRQFDLSKTLILRNINSMESCKTLTETHKTLIEFHKSLKIHKSYNYIKQNDSGDNIPKTISNFVNF